MEPRAPIRRAFTMIEILVAVALSAVVILIAYAAVRAVARAVREVQRLATENDLIASGWFACSNEADYWLGHASPEYPQIKGPLSEQVVFNGSPDNPWDKRPFRRVNWARVAIDSPSANAGDPPTKLRSPFHLQPHDRGSWYRGGYVADTIPTARSPKDININDDHLFDDASSDTGSNGWGLNAWTPYSLYLTGSDPTTNSVIRANFALNEWFMPAGWDPWHVSGSWADIENVEVKDPARKRQGAHWAVFKEIGHLGVAAYMPSGSPNIAVRPPGNRQAANIGVLEKWYDWGEIPWSQSFGAGASNSGYSTAEFRFPARGADFPDARRGNMMVGNFGPAGATRPLAVYRHAKGPAWGSFEQVASFESSGGTPYIFCDVERALRRYRNAKNTEDAVLRIRQWLEPCMPYPTRPIYRPDRPAEPYDTTTLMDGLLQDPIRTLISSDNGEWNIADISTFADQYTVRSWLQPQLPADSYISDLSQIPPDAPTLRIGSLRFRAQGADRAHASIVVEYPGSGTRIEVPFTLLGSSFRGARQHWGWKTRHDRSDLPAMGDVYEP